MNDTTVIEQASTLRGKLIDYLSLERNVSLASAAVFILGSPKITCALDRLVYLIRSLSITPAAAIGGLLWSFAPWVPFIVAGIIGLIGTFVFAITVEERYAG